MRQKLFFTGAYLSRGRTITLILQKRGVLIENGALTEGVRYPDWTPFVHSRSGWESRSSKFLQCIWICNRNTAVQGASWIEFSTWHRSVPITYPDAVYKFTRHILHFRTRHVCRNCVQPGKLCWFISLPYLSVWKSYAGYKIALSCTKVHLDLNFVQWQAAFLYFHDKRQLTNQQI